MKNLLLRISLVVVSASITVMVMNEVFISEAQLEARLANSQLDIAESRVAWLENRIDNLSASIELKDENLSRLTNEPNTWDDFEYLAKNNEVFFYFVLGSGILIGLLIGLLIVVLYKRSSKRKLEKLKYHNARSLNLRNEQIEGLTKELTELQEAYELVA